MNILLVRDDMSPLRNMGVMTAFEMELQSLELPWIPDPFGGRGGDPDKSCVPPGIYDLVLHDTIRHPKTFALVNRDLDVLHNADPAVPRARTEILIHSANLVDQLLGCIGVGLARYGNEILKSGDALIQFKDVVPWIDGHTITIKNA